MSDTKNVFPPETSVGSIPLEYVSSHTGIELFEKMLAGELPSPPIAKTMNFTLSEAEKGRAVFRGTPLFDHYNPLGTVHGGWAATILDSALGCCVHTMLPAGIAYTTIEFKVNLVRPMFSETGPVVCEGKVIHFGRTIATSEATLKTLDGKLIAHGTETCAIFPLGSKG
ncbi:MAG: PaaI family thioesterase [Nitratireductor sp.]